MMQAIFPVKLIIYHHSKKLREIHFRDFLVVHIDFAVIYHYLTLTFEQNKVGLIDI